MKVYKAVIVGCGRIGTGFDSPDSDEVLTHANAFSRSSAVTLKAVMDVDWHVAVDGAEKWGCKPYGDFEKMVYEQHPDIISLCIPDELHFQYLLKCAEFKPKAVIAEKPLTLNLVDSEEVVNKYHSLNIALIVNYTRRYDTSVQSVRERIERDEFGKLINATFRYTKGLLHNGSHAVDLANFLFGNYLRGDVLGRKVDFSDSDPTLSAFLSYSLCPEVFLIACDERAYSIFEVDIIAEKGRIVFDQFGLKCREYAVRDDPVFPGYKDTYIIDEADMGLEKALLNLVDNVVSHLNKGQKIICSGEDALLAQSICDDLALKGKGAQQEITGVV